MTLTPKQFSILATKDDVKEAIIASEERMTKKIDKILTAVDGIAKNFQKFEVESAANVGAHDRFEKRFTETNGRVEVLEKKLGASRAAA
ncbi:MAG: hypothetical protein UU95_C0026G0014 [Parcubacteria group bacterium GW2011_GWC2_42_12]|nr:MAG: hypothetical protein UU95_C0026G0014 [Parcubacteria group bacterium GW2011_GWC2_42_12]